MAEGKTALINVRVFDGYRIQEPSTVIIERGLISEGNDTSAASIINCNGHVLLPGLIDCHIHLDSRENLIEMRNAGVTTALDMGTPMELYKAIRNDDALGVTDLRGSGVAATSPGSFHAKLIGFPREDLVQNPVDAKLFVQKRAKEGADYIKIITDTPGPDQLTLNSLVTAARAHKRCSIAHAASFQPFKMAQEARMDMITHVPLDQDLDAESMERMVKSKQISIPTLTMMKAITGMSIWSGLVVTVIKLALTLQLPRRRSYDHACASVTAMHKAGIPILAGTDANNLKGLSAHVPHGMGLHQELELLVEAGLSNLEALRSATVLPAEHFRLDDRGIIEPGRRADLLLVAGDPLEDIRATQAIERVWCGGIEHVPAGKPPGFS